MNTAQEALFKAMMNDAWFTKTDGETDSPTGFFGYVVNKTGDWHEISEAFSEVIAAYGKPSDHEFYGAFTAVINDQGVIRIVKWDNEDDAKKVFDKAVNDYQEWLYS